ncbi:MAG: ferritin-like domain-containing protein [Egibacteraceae bacterium]
MTEAGEWKIFPRNLTARADFQVRGNPANTRPESGVDNCFPGLEFDQRNLDKAFFPGLSFEFHRPEGAILREVAPGSAAVLSNADMPLYLLAVVGRTTFDQDEQDPPALLFFGRSGLEVWRRVHDLLPGRIAVMLGPQSGFSAAPVSEAEIRQLWRDGQSAVQRRGDGAVPRAFLVGERARYLDDDGVIDVDAYPPGELTRSLCAPWQYGFRDCGCFYWAASKPDIVTSADSQHDDLNFQRRDRAPTPDIARYAPRRALELDYPELIEAWNTVLPVVVNDRETDAPLEEPVFTGALLDRERALADLRYLAGVEHALSVEYLYAHYSLAAPMRLPPGAVSQTTRRIFAAASEVFAIAVDEMRHLRWANEALALLGEPLELGRAQRIGRQLDRPFLLAPLTAAQLQWFIDVEAPSQAVGQGVDGMYVRLPASVERQPQLFGEEADRLSHLLKLIIDEGQDHYERFLRRYVDCLGVTDP